MGLFSGSKKDHQENAKRLAEAAKKESDSAQAIKARASKIRRSDRSSRHPDPAATRAITRDLDMNRRVHEKNAKDLRSMAVQSERLAKKWF